MCTEPSAFGASASGPKTRFPASSKMLYDYDGDPWLKKPNCRTDGLLPFVLKRLRRCRGRSKRPGTHPLRRRPRAAEHRLVSAGPYRVPHRREDQPRGNPPAARSGHRLPRRLDRLQARRFDSIDGIFLLDDLIGFLRDDDFQQFALPYLKRIFDSLDVSVRMLHNDAAGLITARHLAGDGREHVQLLVQPQPGRDAPAGRRSVVLLGNIPPRDVLAQGTPDDVRHSVAASLATIEDKRRLDPFLRRRHAPDAPTANVEAFK